VIVSHFIHLVAKFDVRRSDKDHYTLACVTRVDFVGTQKKIRFHFAKSSTCRDEWIEFGSDRIAPMNTKSRERIAISTKKSKKRKGGVEINNYLEKDRSIIVKNTGKNLFASTNGCDLASADGILAKVDVVKAKKMKRNEPNPSVAYCLSHNLEGATESLVDINQVGKKFDVAASDGISLEGKKVVTKILKLKDYTPPNFDAMPVCKNETVLTLKSENRGKEFKRKSVKSVFDDAKPNNIEKTKKNRSKCVQKSASVLDSKQVPTNVLSQSEGESTSESQKNYINASSISIGGK
jgi:hypothetical protein